jgi:hypothetical protein
MNPEETQSTTTETQEVALVEMRRLFLPQEMFPKLQDELEAMQKDIQAEITAANLQTVATVDDAEYAGVLISKLDERTKLIQEKTKPFTEIAFRLHRWLTGFTGRNTTPIETARRALKQRVIAWQTEQERIAENQRRELQAKADRETKEERDRLQREIDRKNAEAQAAKRPETVERRQEEVRQLEEAKAAVVAPVVNVAPARASTVKTQKRWTATVEDLGKFLEAASKDPNLRGYLTVDTTKLARGKSANTSLLVPGIKFGQTTV